MPRSNPTSRVARRLSVACLWAIGASARSAHADEPQPIRVEYHVHEGCPTEAELVDEIRARTSRVRLAQPGEPARTLVVDVTRDAERSVGRLQAIGALGAETAREVSGSSCADVVSGLALIAAISIDPGASTAPRVAPAAAPPPPAPPEPPPPTPPPVVSPAASEAPAPWRWMLGVEGMAIGAVAPGRSYGGGIFIALHDSKETVLSPELRLEVLHTARGPVDSPPGAASFQWTGARLDLCPLRIGTPSFTIRPCAGIQGGALRAEGQQIADPKDATAPWSAADLTGRLAYALGRVNVGLQGGIVLPLSRHTFRLDDPPRVVHAVPPVGGLAAIDIGYELP